MPVDGMKQCCGPGVGLARHLFGALELVLGKLFTGRVDLNLLLESVARIQVQYVPFRTLDMPPKLRQSWHALGICSPVG